MSSMHNQNPNDKGKTPRERKAKPHDIKSKYDAFFPIYSEEEGKKFCSLTKRKLYMPKYFDDNILTDIEMHDFINTLCKQLGWTQLKSI